MSGLGPETRALLERGRQGEAPTPATRARMRGALVAQLAGASTLAATTTTAAAAKTSVFVIAAKIIGVAVVVSAAGYGSRWVWPVIESGSTAHDVAVASTNVPTTVKDAPIAEAPRAPNEVTPVTPQSPLELSNRNEAIAKLAIDAPTPVPRAQGSTASRIEAARAVASGHDLAENKPAPTLPKSVPSAALAEEARLLTAAHIASASYDPLGALALLDEHARRFPNGTLAPERDAERVFVLCDAGKKDEARKEGVAFVKAHPEGALTNRVQTSCAFAR